MQKVGMKMFSVFDSLKFDKKNEKRLTEFRIFHSIRHEFDGSRCVIFFRTLCVARSG